MTGGMSRGTPGDNIGSTPAGIIGSTSGGPLEVKVETPRTETTPSAREQIEGHLSALKSLLKEHNGRGNVSSIHLSFDDVEDRTRVRTVVTGKEIGVTDLKKFFKEAVKTPLTRRIIEFAGPKFKMPANIKLYDETTDSEDHLRSIEGWAELIQQFITRFSTRRACFKDPTEITKIVRKANETLVAFKERWIVETGFITGVPEVMKISSFMDAHKCPELAKRYSDKVPKMVDEMTTRLDDFDWSAERKIGSTREDTGLTDEETKEETRLTIRTEPQLNLQPPRPMQLPPKKETQDKYCEYHGEKGHYTNDCFQLRRQLEMDLESGKLNHLIKDVRQRGRGNMKGRDVGKDKVINMIRSWPNDRKRKSVERDESWMKASIVFPPLSMEDASDEPLIIEAVMEGYLVRRIYVDQGASVEVRFEHCFENLSPAIRSRLRDTQMDLVGFAGGVVRPLGKIELEVVFGDGGLFRTVMINFTVVRAPSPYNVIFRRTGLRSLRAVSSTIHSMVKFPTPRGVATLVTQSGIISECQRLKRKQMVEYEVNQNINQEKEASERVDLTEQTLVNPAYPNQLVTIGGNLLEQCKNQLRILLKKSMDVFAWEPANMKGIPRRVIEHSLNVNPSVEPVAQKRRVMASDRTQVIGRNLEAFVDDVVIKSNDEKVLIEDIAETFDNLRRINMKLNPKKYSFGVEEGKFLGYMVTFEEIRANPKKTKAIADMQSPRTLKEMQSRSGKLVALKRFLSRSTEKSLPFFETLKDITKENKDEYR
ncbi:hypothetical protein Tco_0890901 [Tanacetum coccineum]|uniref:Reverse transcriptase domain-containing protein n=1 Tax=Tanacetum coccineum TaxID=301880 RepID=A0ABQ5C7D5_9ASTR